MGFSTTSDTNNTSFSKIVQATPHPVIVTSFEVTSNYQSELDEALHLDVCCDVNVTNIVNNNAEGRRAHSIDIYFSPYSLDYYRQKASVSTFTELQKLQNERNAKSSYSKKSKSKNLSTDFSNLKDDASADQQAVFNDAIANAYAHKVDRNTLIFDEAHKVGVVSLTQIDVANELYGPPKKKTRVSSFEITKNLQDEIEIASTLNTAAYQKIYQSAIKQGKDPSSLFQDSYMKTSYDQQRNGVLSTENKRNDSFLNEFKPIFKSIENQIKKISSNSVKFENYYEESSIRKVSGKVFINLSKLKEVAEGNTFYVLFIVKDVNGYKLEVENYATNVSDIENQIRKESTNYSVATKRLNNGVSIFNISNKDKYSNLSVNLHTKKGNGYVPFENMFYNSFKTAFLSPRENKIIRDGKIGLKTNSPSQFKKHDTAYYRTTLNYRGKRYYNAKSRSDKGKTIDTNFPYLTISAKVVNDTDTPHMEITVENIAQNISAVRIRKQKVYHKNKKTNPREFHLLLDRNGGIQKSFQNVPGGADQSSAIFRDFNVYRTDMYKYVVECIMKNGEIKFAPAYCYEIYEDRTGVVAINNVSLAYNNRINQVNDQDLNGYYDLEEQTKTTIINFDVKIIESEIDKLFKSMFGNLFELYKKDLQDIRKGIQPLVTSIRIDRINHLAGTSNTIGKVSTNESGKYKFEDTTCPIYGDVTYKLSPRVIPANDFITIVNDLLVKLHVSESSKTQKYYAGAKLMQTKKGETLTGPVLSIVGSKYLKRSDYLKGVISKPGNLSLREVDLDIFAGASTGDIKYVTKPGVKMFADSNFKFKSVRSLVNEIRVANQTYDMESMRSKEFEIDIVTSGLDYYVDFYAIFVKENNDVYLDGIMHSTDSTSELKKYPYYIKHTGSNGIIEYYIVPFLKNGTISTPSFLAAHEIKK